MSTFETHIYLFSLKNQGLVHESWSRLSIFLNKKGFLQILTKFQIDQIWLNALWPPPTPARHIGQWSLPFAIFFYPLVGVKDQNETRVKTQKYWGNIQDVFSRFLRIKFQLWSDKPVLWSGYLVTYIVWKWTVIWVSWWCKRPGDWWDSTGLIHCSY